MIVDLNQEQTKNILTITNIPPFAKKCSLPVLMYPIDEDEPSFDGINLTVGATRTFSV